MKRPKLQNSGKSSKVAISDKNFSTLYPTLTEWMSDPTWDDGKPRQLATLSINFSTGMVGLGLSDHDAKASVYTTSDTIEGALLLLEEALSTQTVVWRRWKQGRA